MPDMPPPALSAVDVSVGLRDDGRYSLGFWLKRGDLSVMFTLLCDDLVRSTLDLEADAVPSFMLARLMRWRRLFEPGEPHILGTVKLRGLVGELVVMRACFDVWDPGDVVSGWVGPLEAPQDFSLPGASLEAKAILPGAGDVWISSVNQLEAPRDRKLYLSIVELASSTREGQGSSSVSELVVKICERLGTGTRIESEFMQRLQAYGYVHHPDYEAIYFRIDSMRVFSVVDEFPRIRQPQLMPGIGDVKYQIGLSACEPYRSALEP